MFKNNIFIAAVMSALVMSFSACSDNAPEVDNTKHTITLEVNTGALSRTTHEYDESAQQVKTYWSEGDELLVSYKSGGSFLQTPVTMKLKSGAGTQTAVFEGEIVGEPDILYAAYGKNVSYGVGQFYFNYEGTKIVSDISEFGSDDRLVGTFTKNENGVYQGELTHAAALLRLNLTGLTPGTKITGMGISGLYGICKYNLHGPKVFGTPGEATFHYYNKNDGIQVSDEGTAIVYCFLFELQNEAIHEALPLTFTDSKYKTFKTTLPKRSTAMSRHKMYNVDINVTPAE